MDVYRKTKAGDLELVGVIDITDSLCETGDDLLRELFSEAVSEGIPLDVSGEPAALAEIVRLKADDPRSAQAFVKYVEHVGGYRVRDV